MNRVRLIMIITVLSFIISGCGECPLAKRLEEEDGPEKAEESPVVAAPSVAPEATTAKVDLRSGVHILVDARLYDWDGAEIRPLEGLDWKNVHSMPVFEQTLRIKSIRIALGENELYFLFKLNPGVRERFLKEQRTGSIAYIYLDSDASEDTGFRRHINDKYAGWDYRIYVDEGFIKSGYKNDAKPAAFYHIEKIVNYTEEKVKHGISYNCEVEEVEGGEKASYNLPAHLAFQGDILEFRVPFELVGISQPSDLKFVVQDLSAVPDAQCKIDAHIIEGPVLVGD